MKYLAELEPGFIRYEERDNGVYHVHVTTLAEAHGIDFLCPKCGMHHVVCWRRGMVPDHAFPGPGRWIFEGDSLDNLTLKPSVHLTGGCGWHGHITNGEVTSV